MIERAAQTKTPLQNILDFEAEYVTIGNESKDSYAKLMADWSSGLALQELDVDEDSDQEEAIRVYPVGINYCQRVVSAVSGVVWGEWDNQRPSRVFQPQFDVPIVRAQQSEADLAQQQQQQSQQQKDRQLLSMATPPQPKTIIGWGTRGLKDTADTVKDMLLRVLFGEVKGNSIFSDYVESAVARGTSTLYLPYQYRTGRFSASILPLQYVHYLWDDNGKITEAAVTKVKTIYEAQQMGYQPSPDWIRNRGYLGLSTPDRVVYWEWWTPQIYSRWIEDQCLESMPNPTMGMQGFSGLEDGIIPLFPLRFNRVSDEWYGHSDIEGSIDIVQEINRVVADIGENINMTNVPLIWFLNALPDGSTKTAGDFLQRIGRHVVLMLKGDPQAKVGSIERPVLPPDTSKYLDTLIQFLEDTGLLPGPVLGRVKGTQTSAVALQTEMRPIIDVARKHRIELEQTLQDVIHYILTIARATNLEGQRNRIVGKVWGVTQSDADDLTSRFYVGYAPLLPKDATAERDGIIAEVVNMLEYPENALRRLGREDPVGDWEKIREYQEWKSNLGIQGQMAINEQQALLNPPPGQVPGQQQPGAQGRPAASPQKKEHASPQQAVPRQSR